MDARRFPIDPQGVWHEVAPQAARGGGALFLDRDGVVVEEVDYLCRVEDVAVIPGAASVIAAANRLRIPVVLITNQAGIARGYYGWEEFAAVQHAISESLAHSGAKVDAVLACPYHPDGKGIYRHPDHPDRKPNPGMLLQAAADLELDFGQSWLVGDKLSDIDAAARAGLAGAMHVLTGHGAAERKAVEAVKSAFRLHLRFGRSIEDAGELPVLVR